MRGKIILAALALLGLVAWMISCHQFANATAGTSINILLMRRTTNVVGEEVVVAQINNNSRFGYNFSYTVEVMTNGLWEVGGLYHPQMREADHLAPHATRMVELKVVDHATSVCRIRLGAGRAATGTEEKAYRFWRRISGKNWPFTRNFEVFSPPFDMAQQ